MLTNDNDRTKIRKFLVGTSLFNDFALCYFKVRVGCISRSYRTISFCFQSITFSHLSTSRFTETFLNYIDRELTFSCGKHSANRILIRNVDMSQISTNALINFIHRNVKHEMFYIDITCCESITDSSITELYRHCIQSYTSIGCLGIRPYNLTSPRSTTLSPLFGIDTIYALVNAEHKTLTIIVQRFRTNAKELFQFIEV